MTLATDIANDMADMDGIETVTLTGYRSGSTVTDTSVTALRRALSHREVDAGGPVGLDPSDLVWHLQANTITTIVPAPGDTITDGDSVVWTVISASKETLGTRWRCLTRKQT